MSPGDGEIVLLCATRRGLAFLRRLRQLCPASRTTVVSFPEDPWEPAFLAAIREEAAASGCGFFETRDAAGERMRSFWEGARPGLILLVNWRYRLPASVYRRPGWSCAVFHDSLLPAYRGFSPLNWALINGEERTGATLFSISDEIDAGDIIDQAEVPIGDDEGVGEVMEKVTQAYLLLLEQNLPLLQGGRAPRRPQDHAGATYCTKILPGDMQIDWRWPARRVHNFIRALSRPYPGAFTTLEGKRLTVWRATPFAGRRYAGAVPGAVAELRPPEGVLVLTGEGALLVESVELEGSEAAPAFRVLDRISLRLGRP